MTPDTSGSVNGSSVTVLIRHAHPGDVRELRRLTLGFLAESIYGRLLEPNEEAIGRLISTVMTHGTVIVGETIEAHQARLVGMLAIVKIPHPVSGQPYADEIAWFVEKPYRKGLGRNLLGAATLWARQNACTLLKMVAPAGSSAGRLYESLGFEPLETAYVMRLSNGSV